MIILNALPFLLFGLRFFKLPIDSIPVTHNWTINDSFYQTVIFNINRLSKENGSKVVLLPPNYYPIFALKKDISWTYDFSSNGVTLYVVDKPMHDRSFLNSTTLIAYIEKEQDKENLKRFFYLVTDK